MVARERTLCGSCSLHPQRFAKKEKEKEKRRKKKEKKKRKKGKER